MRVEKVEGKIQYNIKLIPVVENKNVITLKIAKRKFKKNKLKFILSVKPDEINNGRNIIMVTFQLYKNISYVDHIFNINFKHKLKLKEKLRQKYTHKN